MENYIDELEVKRNFLETDIEENIFKWYEFVEKELAEHGPTERLGALRKITNSHLRLIKSQLQYWDMRAEYNAERDLPEEEPVTSEEFRGKLKTADEMKAKVKKQWKKLNKQHKKKRAAKKTKK